MEHYKMKILLSGATGFIGRSLLKKLLTANHHIYALVRQVDNRLDASINQLTLASLSVLNEQFDVIINLAGENIASRPWTKKRKQTLLNSRVELTNNIKSALKYPPKLLISMSAVGYYGVASQGVFYESTPPKEGFSHDLCAAWEASATAFYQDQTRVVIFRLGVVLGDGGALSKMRTPFLFGLGGPIAGGKQWFSWVHIDDVVEAIFTAIDDQTYTGAYNLVAPQLIEQDHFAKSYAASLNRPAALPTPKWMLKLLFGEMACLLTEGAKIVPQKLEKQGFRFCYTNIDEALLQIEQVRH
ncbi:MAG: hypothetical protein ACJAWI_002058 [Marinomonas primoryensis]|jgi:uncharacterized protein (TIGR01777 family)|tara:strand:+ start:12628 stop:13527 length:900 start_codon:yes stop_codon:yes gene_type:complete